MRPFALNDGSSGGFRQHRTDSPSLNAISSRTYWGQRRCRTQF